MNFALPRYWVPKEDVLTRINNKSNNILLGFTNVTSSTNERSMIATILPLVGVGHSMPLIMSTFDSRLLSCLEANLNSFCFDYFGRQKLGGINFTFFILKQLPILPPDTYTQPCPWLSSPTSLLPIPYSLFLLPRVLELTYTAWDLELFANDCGYAGPPFRWNEERRFLLRCELDAAYFHLYGIARDDVDYIMETFPIVKRKDEAQHGEYRTKRVILKIFDAMQQAMDTGVPYRTRLDPPPADPRVAHQS